MDDITSFTGVNSALDQLRETVEVQNRTIRYLLSNYESLLRKVERERPSNGGGNGKPWDLWGGPYPLEVGPTPPSQVKVWFSTVGNALLVWQFSTQLWVPVSATVFVGPNPPSGPTLGQLYMDATQKLWVHIDDWRELTQAVPANVTVTNGVPMVTAFDPPASPTSGSLWFEPARQNLSVFLGSWIRIGERLQRFVRNANWTNTWNAGGNRSQGVRAGELLYVAGMRGINPVTQAQEPGPGPAGAAGTTAPNLATDGGLARNNRIWSNIQVIVEAEGLTLQDCYGITTAVTNLSYLGVTIQSQAQPQFFGIGPYPPRTHEVWLQMSGGDQEREFGAEIPNWPVRGDITEITAMFYTGRAGRRKPSAMADMAKAIPGVTVAEGIPASMAMPVQQNEDEDDEPTPTPRRPSRRR
jgi:enamine deaminase RidA (YjgF/YER057c/UK114 family)